MPLDEHRVKEIFLAAVEKPAPADRAAYLDAACGTDAGLLDRVRALIKAHETKAGPLAQPIAGVHGTILQTPEEIAANSKASPPRGELDKGQVLAGRYKLLQKLGEGGMGVVWKAEQIEPVRRIVALKVIKAAVGSGQTLARFEAERQALAMMDHPNIARVLDAGEAENGRPFFVMELVKGIPITKYCDEQQLTPQQRLELFIPICQAVQHAHQKGVIHRDLKPSNILIALYDGRPIPKVIDFGIAKATSQRLTERTLDTDVGQIIGTLEYMPPEQAELNNLDIDTRADVYALGVVLYELLTGSTPFSGKQLREAGFYGMLQMIREVEPQRPSTRISSSGALPSIAAQRKLEPKRLTYLVTGDLDWIVMKCLEKERARRYETANSLAMDIQRYLADGEVEARPPSAGYRLQKFVRRNRGAVLAAMAIAVVLVAGIVGTTLGLIEAQISEKRADEQAQIAREQEWIAKERAEEAKQNERKALAQEAEAAKQQAEALKQATIAKENEGKSLAQEAEAKNQQAEAIKQATIAKENENKANLALREKDTALKDLQHNLALERIVMAQSAFDNKNLDLAREHLAGIPSELRRWEWYYLQRQFEGGIFTLDTGGTSVRFSPDGTRIVTSSYDAAKVWDARTGRSLLDLKGHMSLVTSVGFSPDGTRIVTGSRDKTAKVWDAKAGDPLLDLKGHTGTVNSVGFSPDGTRIVTGSGDKTVKVWDAITGKPLFDLKEDIGTVNSVGFSPDGTRIVTGSADKTAKVWDAKTGKPLLELKGLGFDVTSVGFSPDGTRIVTGGWGTAGVWDAKTGNPLLELKGHTGTITSVGFSPDGTRIITGSGDKTVKVWDAKTGNSLLEFKGHTNSVNGIGFSPDGTHIVAVSSDETKVWDAKTGNPLLELKGDTNELLIIDFRSSAGFSPDGARIVTGSADKSAKIWDAKSGNSLLDLKGHTDDVTSVGFSPDGARIVTGSADKSAKVWDAKSGKSLLDLKGHTSTVSSVGFSPDGARIVTGSADKSAKVWDAKSGKSLLDLKGHTSTVSSVGFSPDGARIVTGSDDKTAKVWDAKSGKSLLDLKGHTGDVTSAGFSPDGARIVTGSWDNTAKIWDAKTGNSLLDFKGHTRTITSVGFSPDGSRIVTGSYDHTAKVWDAKTGKPLLDLKGHTGDVTSVCFSPDGSRIVTGCEDTAKVWEAPFTFRDGNHVVLIDRQLSPDEWSYRLFWTRPRPDLHQEEFDKAIAGKDAFAARFHLDRLLAYQRHNRLQLLVQRLESQPNDWLVQTRTTVHSPALATAALDVGLWQPPQFEPLDIVLWQAGHFDPLALRLLGGTLIRAGQPAKAIVPLKLAQTFRRGDRPPVEELLLALACLDAKQPEEANRWYAQAIAWLDRYKMQMQVMSALGAFHAGPLQGATELLKTPVDPRYNAFDWETWYECEVFRAEVEAKLRQLQR